MSVELLSEQHLEFLSLTGGCTVSSESTLVNMPHCWKSHVMAQLCESSIFQVNREVAKNGIQIPAPQIMLTKTWFLNPV